MPAKLLRESFRNFVPPGFTEAKRASEMMSLGKREMEWVSSISRATGDIENLSQKFSLTKVAQMERLMRPFQVDEAMLDRLTRPFGIDKTELLNLTNPLGSQVELLKKLQEGIFDFHKIRKIVDVEGMLGGSHKQAEEMFRSLVPSSIVDVLNKFEWNELRATIASAAEATKQTEIKSAVTQALAQSNSGKSSTSSALSEFLQALLKESGAGAFGKLMVWYFVFEFLKMILLSASTSTTDYYVKDHLSKAAQAEDRRALAKEVAREIGKLNLAREYISIRRYAIKPMNVHMNPRANSPIIGSIRPGELVEIVQVDRDWTHLVFRDFKSKEFSGWAYTRYLKALPSGRATAE